MTAAALLLIAASAVLSAPIANADGGGAPPTPAAASKLTGQYVECCACDRVCESLFGDGGRRSACAFVCALKIEAGQRGEVSLSGVTVALVVPDAASASAKPPATPAFFVDAAASPAQSEALRLLLQERFGARLGVTSLPPAKAAAVSLTRSNESVAISIEGVADLRARPLTGAFRRPVQIENAPGAPIAYPCLGRGVAGQVSEPAVSRLRFDAAGRSFLFGKFDYGPAKGKRGG